MLSEIELAQLRSDAESTLMESINVLRNISDAWDAVHTYPCNATPIELTLGVIPNITEMARKNMELRVQFDADIKRGDKVLLRDHQYDVLYVSYNSLNLSKNVILAFDFVSEYGEMVDIENRSGSIVNAAVKAFANPISGFENYYPEYGDNADDPGHCTIYVDGSISIEDGYKIVRQSGSYTVLTVAKPQDGANVTVNIAKCAKI